MLDLFLDFFVSVPDSLLVVALVLGIFLTVMTERYLSKFFALLTLGICAAYLIGLYFTGDPTRPFMWVSGILLTLATLALLSILFGRQSRR